MKEIILIVLSTIALCVAFFAAYHSFTKEKKLKRFNHLADDVEYLIENNGDEGIIRDIVEELIEINVNGETSKRISKIHMMFVDRFNRWLD